MSKNLIFIGVLIAVFFAACTSALASITGTHVLGVGKGVIDANGLEVIFIQVLEDSRCPADAMCIRQGNVKVLIEITVGTETQQHALTLSEMDAGDVNSIEAGGYLIALEQVDPYPLASQPTDPASYQATISIYQQ